MRVIYICVGLGIAGFMGFLLVRDYRIASEGMEADAVVTWWDHCRERRRTSFQQQVCVRYRFEHDGHEYDGKGSLSLKEWSKVGNTLKVRFLASSPGVNRPSAQRGSRQLSLALGVVCVIVGAVSIRLWKHFSVKSGPSKYPLTK